MDRFVAIDPLALMLRSDIYVKIHLPDPPPPDVLKNTIREMVKGMGTEERKLLLARAKSLNALTSAIEREVGKAVAAR